MFDMGFTELMLIGIVALVVIGPERLPGVARTAGKYIGRLKRFMTTVKADVEQELRADELRQILSDQQKELDSLKDTISEAGRNIEADIGVSESVAEAAAAATEAIEEPSHKDADASGPAVAEAVAAEPVANKPAAKKPATRKPAAKKAAAKKPAAKKAAAKKPAARKKPTSKSST
ncbi:Sec-independent protein translocase protein TatB [Gammaproteobacteria bacterium]|nr:Sec-independent protein translocase protein TatB [Gammaproteobacteria bacterium]